VYTPGPWIAFDDGFVRGIILEPIASTRFNDNSGPPQDLKIANANARLIATAPELLDALQAIVAAWDSPKERAALSYVHLEAAKDVIAKAIGAAGATV